MNSQKMKHSLLTLALLIILVFLINSDANANKISGGDQPEMTINKKSAAEMENPESFEKLMGQEVCRKEDEDCLKRKVIAEAHLDYIYTQHQRP